MFKILFYAILLTAGVAKSPAECPSFEQTAVLLTVPSRESKPAVISGECFCHLLSSPKTASEIIPLIEAYTRRYSVGDTLLFCAYRNLTIRNNASVFAAIVFAWKKHASSVASRIQQYQQSGAFHEMDTLCTILDLEHSLDTYQLLRWIDVKRILEDLDAIAPLYYRVLLEKPELLPLVLNQFGTLLQDIPPDRAASMLNRFCESGIRNDTAINRVALPWVIEQYGMKGFFNRQMEVAERYAISLPQRFELLYRIAQHQSATGNYIQGSNAARAAYRIATDSTQRQDLAVLLFNSYKRRGVFDSAHLWFERAGAKVAEDLYDKIDVLLSTGDLTKAAEYIGKLPNSFTRDTLKLRQLLLSDSTAAAFSLAFSEQRPLVRSPFAAIWRVRTALFAGKSAQCREILDSITIDPSTLTASELLDYRYWLMRLADSPEDLAKFTQIEYTMFKGMYEKASRMVCDLSATVKNRWRFAVRTARRQLASSEYAGAVATLLCVPADSEPEYLYCLADALYHNKDIQKSKKILERLIMDFPSNMYTAQARNLYSSINKQAGRE